MTDEYLWAAPGPTPAWSRWADAAPLAFRPQPLGLDLPTRRSERGSVRHAAALVDRGGRRSSGGGRRLALTSSGRRAARLDIEALAGEPLIASRPAGTGARWRVGEGCSRARARAPARRSAGQMELDPARARCVPPRRSSGCGSIASSCAPACWRLRACSWSRRVCGRGPQLRHVLRVDDAGSVCSTLPRAGGLGGRDHGAIVPAGTSCRLRPGRAGTPPSVTPARLRAAARAFDDTADPPPGRGAGAVAPRDSITLWHCSGARTARRGSASTSGWPLAPPWACRAPLLPVRRPSRPARSSAAGRSRRRSIPEVRDVAPQIVVHRPGLAGRPSSRWAAPPASSARLHRPSGGRSRP
jgi:hypothetical protein